MGKLTYLGSKTPLPQAVANRLTAEGRDIICSLASTYDVETRTFYRPIQNIRNMINQETALINMRNFFLQDRVHQGFTEARERVFSQRDRKKDTQTRYADAVETWAEHLVDYFQQKRTFLQLEGFEKMWQDLMKYDEQEPTPHSIEIRDGFRRIVQEQRGEFSRLRMVPLVYGSTRFGDAGRNSDIDVVFCYSTPLGIENATHSKLKELITTIDRAVEADFDQHHQIRDIDRLEGVMVDLDEVLAVAGDIVNGETTRFEDYTFKGDPLYAFHTLLEGKSPITGFGEIEEQLAEVQGLLHQGAAQDPYFNLLLSYKIMFSLEKRQKNQHRR